MVLMARILGAGAIFAVLTAILVGWYQNFLLGAYWETAPLFLTIIYGALVPIASIGLLGKAFITVITMKE